MSLLLGYAQTVISPSLDSSRLVYLAGFGQNRIASGIHDDLYVRAVAMQGTGQTVVLVSADLIGLGSEVCRRCEANVQAIIPDAHLVISCTHTHHGPDTLGLWGPDRTTPGVDPVYMQQLEESLTRTALDALNRMEPAVVRSSATVISGVVKNVRNPDILDQELVCLQFLDPDSHHIRLTLANFACHPETLWKTNPEITSDYPHFLRAQVECLTLASCVFFSGALGGMMTPDVTDHSFEEAEQIGILLSHAAVESLRRQSPMPDDLRYAREEFTISIQSPLLEQAMAVGLIHGSRIEHLQAITQVGLLQIGPAWFVHVPGELLPALGLQIKAVCQSRGASVVGVIGLSNDELGYILPEEEFIYPQNPFEPGDHYEETMSISPKAGSLIMSAVRSLIDQMENKRGKENNDE